jgi:hypothetical protein
MAKRNEKKAETTAIAPVEQGGELAELNSFFLEDAGAGTENIGAGDVALPFLQIIQKGSPQVDDGHAKYIPEARPGMVLNTVTNELYDGREKGIEVIACGYVRNLVRWKPRDSGGGFVSQYPVDDPIQQRASVNEKRQLVLPGGDLLIDTANFFVLRDTIEGVEQSIIAMTSTNLKVARRWNSLIVGRTVEINGRKIKPPMFGQRYRLTTVRQEKDGNTWYIWAVEFLGLVDNVAVYQAAKKFYEAVAKGQVKAVPQQPAEHEDGDAPVSNKDVPF